MGLFSRPKRPTRPSDDPIFYTIPAWAIDTGMSTAEGSIVCGDAREVCGEALWETCLPENRSAITEHATPARQRVRMATFWDTEVDGSTLPDAKVERGR